MCIKRKKRLQIVFSLYGFAATVAGHYGLWTLYISILSPGNGAYVSLICNRCNVLYIGDAKQVVFYYETLRENIFHKCSY